MHAKRMLDHLGAIRPGPMVLWLFLSFGLTACFSSYVEKNDQLSFFAQVDEDPPYYQALSNWTKEAYIIRDFETKYIIRVSYLAPKLRQEFENRVKRLFLNSNPNFAQVAPKAGFFVSIFSPEHKAADLRDSNLWAILLHSGGNRLVPSAVDNLTDQKMRWKPFFPYIDTWSQEFLVVFDSPSITPNAEELLKKVDLGLIFSNADAGVTFNW